MRLHLRLVARWRLQSLLYERLPAAAAAGCWVLVLVLVRIVPALVEVRGEVQALGLCAAWSVCARCDAGGAVDRGRGAVMGGKLRARIRLQASVMPR